MAVPLFELVVFLWIPQDMDRAPRILLPSSRSQYLLSVLVGIGSESIHFLEPIDRIICSLYTLVCLWIAPSQATPGKPWSPPPARSGLQHGVPPSLTPLASLHT